MAARSTETLRLGRYCLTAAGSATSPLPPRGYPITFHLLGEAGGWGGEGVRDNHVDSQDEDDLSRFLPCV